jgi:single-strand DNA-binding protein
MANDLNQCNFIGRLGADPDIRFMPDGTCTANFRIAVGWKTKDKEGAEWASIVAFGKLAEIIQQYVKKGQQVFISGRMRTRKWTDKNNQERYSTEIVADQMQMLGGKRDDQHSEQKTAPSAPTPAQAAPSSDFEDDIPF